MSAIMIGDNSKRHMINMSVIRDHRQFQDRYD